jgi:hypothetical protein
MRVIAMAADNTEQVPLDFPQEFLGSVSGAQPKLLVEKDLDGSYVDTAIVRRRERWLICVDLREQLIDYVHKHRPSETALAQYVVQVIEALERKRAGWGISELEAAWISAQLRARFRGE